MTVTVTATAEPGNSPPRIRLNVTSDQATVVLYRVEQDGRRSVVRSYDGGPLPVISGSVLIHDHEAPLGQPVSYTADGTGVTPSGVVTLTGARVWLVHPGVPVRSQPITVAKLSPREYEANQAVRYPLGGQFPIVASDGRRKAAAYQATVRTHSLAEKDAFDELLADLAPLLLNVPANLGWGQVAEYVAIGRVTAGRIVDWGPHPYREWLLPCTVVARPAGGSRAEISYLYSQNLYATYNDRYAAHPTYGDAIDP